MGEQRIIFGDHARWATRRRGLDPDVVLGVVDQPEQIVAAEQGRAVCQSRLPRSSGEKEYLLRVVVERTGDQTVIVTAYRTSRIAKYWRPG